MPEVTIIYQKSTQSACVVLSLGINLWCSHLATIIDVPGERKDSSRVIDLLLRYIHTTLDHCLDSPQFHVIFFINNKNKAITVNSYPPDSLPRRSHNPQICWTWRYSSKKTLLKIRVSIRF